MEMISISTFSERLKTLRKENKIMQKDIALSMKLPIRTYQSYEYGEAEPNIALIVRLADYFDVSLDYLVGRSDNPKRL